MVSEKEYIERGALLKEFEELARLIIHYGERDRVLDAIQRIKNAPAADVVEVRHGEWIESTHWGAWYYDCPFCDDGFATSERRETLPNFCSNCGAKLTGAKMDATDNNVGGKERKEQT